MYSRFRQNTQKVLIPPKRFLPFELTHTWNFWEFFVKFPASRIRLLISRLEFVCLFVYSSRCLRNFPRILSYLKRTLWVLVYFWVWSSLTFVEISVWLHSGFGVYHVSLYLSYINKYVLVYINKNYIYMYILGISRSSEEMKSY